MAQYKVLQDIEAEDKFLGPLTLKQFIFGAIALVSCYLSFIFITKNLWVLAIPLFPVIIVMGFLAFPWGRDQPTETWLLAKIRFFFKPRKRIWNQTGLQELVKITAPPKIVQFYGDNLSQTEVQSRLKALADTVDSRGWAVKNVNVNLSTQLINGAPTTAQGSDRLIDASSLPQVAQITDVGVEDDIFENPRASQVASAIAANDKLNKSSTTNYVKDVVEEQATPVNQAPDYWFMDQPEPTTKKGMAKFGTETIVPAKDSHNLPDNFSSHREMTDPEEAKILSELHTHKVDSGSAFRNHKTVLPENEKIDQNTHSSQMTTPHDAVTMRLAGNNDRVVSSLAKETNEAHPEMPDDEVIISLH